jgi:TPP-dependent indolepyruvate ferredoxin oxidoreductase alpha subunit
VWSLRDMERYRDALLARFKQRHASAVKTLAAEGDDVADRSDEIQEAKAQKAQAEAVIDRLNRTLRLSDPYLCPDCFYIHNITTMLKPVTEQAGDTPKTDKIGCPKCPYTREEAQ